MRRTVAFLLAAAALPAACSLPEGTVGPNDWDLHGVAVHDDTAYVATLTSVLALDLATGGQRWATTYLEPDIPAEASDAP